MHKYKITLEYDGTDYVGWQRQENGNSIQAAIEKAIEKLTLEKATVFGAGRTDAGVHAKGQVAHFDIKKNFTIDNIRDGLNQHLRPQPISIIKVEKATEEFHARFSATMRAYQYVIINRRSPLTIERGRAWLVARPLDATAMSAAGKHLIGRHDFTSFRASECQAASPVKTLNLLHSVRAGDRINITAEARSFLHRQVRNIVGTLVMVGEGKIAPDQVATILGDRNRESAGPCAPPDGLYLAAISYD